ncbi:Calcineurin-like phosphoesterase superfamily protein [Paracoccus alcaliphilus]|uniref:Calcineurin-like phosphoesterase superfamily protein n=1 Tax=Paracoccus alcaliphilus TaxID=34002 RepID=A0A1H8NEI2_9RHOB|nr:phosphoesterase [Paracoccus alcaliphilus]WCR18762.1 phosphoesterase [Paracoccus alcaliphilus]SEO27868.1 Calcineurin-like phosphoesterase superfamily protein [Paracoccus alcaliphilus]
MTTWFSADSHFGHANIITFCNRPCADVEAMDTHILAQYRARVGPEDDFWILGDFAISKVQGGHRREIAEIFQKIPGRKHLILGNHDKAWVRALGWNSIRDTADVTVEGQRLFLFHYPMITFPGARHGALQLFGHVHDNWQGSRNSVNVGVDVWDFRPVSLPEIKERAAKLPVNAHWNEVEPGCAFPTATCCFCLAELDPQLPSGHAIRRGARIVIDETGETIALSGGLSDTMAEGDRICPQCIGGHLSVAEFTLPEGCRYDEQLNIARPVDAKG